MVGVRLKQLSTIGLALVLSTAPAGLVSAQTGDEEPACVPADDGSGDLICQPPDECLDGTNTSDCEPPPECQPLEDGAYRCDPPEETDTTTADGDDAAGNETDRPGLMTSEGAPAEPGPPVVECRPANGSQELVCQQHPSCDESDHPSCRPPAECESVGPDRYRCLPEQAVSAQQNASRGSSGSSSGTEGPECRPGSEPGVMICKPPEECRDQLGDTEACTPPPECESTGDGEFRCTAEAPEGTGAHDGHASVEPSCRAGSEPGTIVCEPPEECQGRIGETEACTPPPTCQRRSDGTFVCQIPDRAGTGAQDAGTTTQEANGSGSTSGGADTGAVSAPDAEMPDEDPFQQDQEEARAQARLQIAEALEQAAREFRGELDGLKSEYKEGLDALRAEFRDSRDQLREDYRDCRASIAENVSGDQRTQELRSCLDEARRGLEDLKTRMKTRYDELNAQFEDRIEEARSQACAQAEQAAIDAVAEHGLFSDNPADLLPDRALELCPSFADFGNQTGGGPT